MSAKYVTDHLCHDMDGVLEVGKYRVGMRGLWGWVRVNRLYQIDHDQP